MLMLPCSLINWRQIQITMLLYSHRLELVSKAFRYEELDGFSSPLRTGPEIYQNGSRTVLINRVFRVGFWSNLAAIPGSLKSAAMFFHSLCL